MSPFSSLPLLPQQASIQAGQVDALYFFMVAVTAFFSFLTISLRQERKAAAAGPELRT